MNVDEVVAHYRSKVRDAYAARGVEYEQRFELATTRDAVRFVGALIDRRPQINTENARMAVDLMFICSNFIADPHDWDSVGNALALVDWYYVTV